MKLILKKASALFLAIVLMISVFSTVSFADDDFSRGRLPLASDDVNYGFTSVSQVGNRALTDSYLQGDTASAMATRAALPSRYDGRDYNYLPPVRNQGNYETCWTFASIAPIEAYMIKHGILDTYTGSPANTSLDLSEYHLAWFNYTNAYDKKGMLTGDYSTPRNANFLMNTGFFQMSIYTLMRWEGVTSEATSALQYGNASAYGLNQKYAYDYDVAHLTNAKWIPMANRDAVKRAIMEYGAGGFGYYAQGPTNSYYNAATAAYCYKGSGSANHAVTVVGWDDNYSRNNFTSTYRPTSNGAWIVRNSWGSSYGESGYFYLSYEDASISSQDVFFFEVDDADNFDNCYQYDGTCNMSSYKGLGNNAQVANIFTADGNETLKAVAIATLDEAVSYTVQVYKNLSTGTNPSSGTLISSQTGYFDYPGYFTVPLNNPVVLNDGDSFSVVFTLSTPSTTSYNYNYQYLHMPYDATDSSMGWVSFTHKNRGNTSYYREANGSWYDCPSYGDFRIKAYTDNSTSTHAHSYGAWTSNGNGTHSRRCTCGDMQTENCSYTEVVTAPTTTSQGYTTHTCTVCGYSYKDNYTAPIENPVYYTVRFSVPGGVSAIASQTVSSTASITLPTAEAPVGYRFAGWSTGTVYETTVQPTLLSGSYTPGGNVTLYAVYTRTEGGTGANVYQLLTSAPADWAGNYVITNGNSTSMYVLKGVTPSSNGAMIESSSNASAFSSTGMTLANNTLSDVSNSYVFNVEANGSAYTVKSAATGSYLGMSSSYLGAYTTLNSSYCNWTPAINASGAAQLKNSASGSYPYLGFSSSGKYFWSASATNANALRLWKATASGTTYYTTSPSASTPEPETTYTVNFSVPSGITAPASQTVTAGGSITLPTAGAPSGYTFLGWVASTVSNATTQPTTYTGTVTVNSNVTLYALYSYSATSGGSGTAYELLTSAPADWTGNYVITYGTNTSSLYAMKGLSGDTKYESSSVGGAVLLSNTGMSYADSKLTGVTDAYVFNISADNGYYTIKNASTGTYVANYNYYLWARSAYASNTCRWTLSCNNGNMTLKNATTNNYPYLSFYNNSKYFMVASTAPTGLSFWKQTTTGGTTTMYYTTG